MTIRKTLILAIALLVLVGCNKENSKTDTDQVQVTVLEPGDGAAADDGAAFVGLIRPAKETVLRPLHQGRITEIAVREGQAVRQGQVIARIESQQIISADEAARATLRQAEDGLRRVSEVHSSGAVADVKLVEVETRVAQARASAASAARMMEECIIRAPYDGIISRIAASTGVEANQLTDVATIMDAADIRAEISLAENALGRVRTGDTARVTVPAVGLEFRARVESKSIDGSDLSHTYLTRLCPLRPVDRAILPGMMCRVSLESRTAETTVDILPADILRMDHEGRYVWVVDRDAIVRKRYIRLGQYRGRGVEVAEGLKPGDRPITAGTEKVSTGMKVKIAQE